VQLRDLGRTGLKVTALGFGAMRLPKESDEEAIALLRRGIELGINYIDTAYGYPESERRVGEAVKGQRDKVYLSTKRPMGPWHSTTESMSADEYRQAIEFQLSRLGVDYVDVWHLHGLLWEAYEKFALGRGILKAVRKAQDEGLIRHLAFSCHDTPANLVRLIDTGEFEVMTVQYNFLDRANEEAIAHAHERGMGVVIMGPVGGGRLAAPSPELARLAGGASTAAIALRFVLANPHVSCAISGMSNMAQLEENVATAERLGALDDAETAQVAAALAERRRLAELYCTGCGYCMPCPNGVDIPANFLMMNVHRVYGLSELARKEYGKLDEGKRAAACIECGQCEPKCPQRIPIMRQLQDTAEALG